MQRPARADLALDREPRRRFGRHARITPRGQVASAPDPPFRATASRHASPPTARPRVTAVGGIAADGLLGRQPRCCDLPPTPPAGVVTAVASKADSVAGTERRQLDEAAAQPPLVYLIGAETRGRRRELPYHESAGWDGACS